MEAIHHVSLLLFLLSSALDDDGTRLRCLTFQRCGVQDLRTVVGIVVQEQNDGE
jgi:hypothetical protein